MAEEEEAAQRHTEASAKTPAAHHRASSQDDTPLPKKQPQSWSTQHTVQILANVLCLLVGVWYVWTTHDILGFILLYGIATGAINAREVVGKMFPEHPHQKEKSKNHHQDDRNESEQAGELQP